MDEKALKEFYADRKTLRKLKRKKQRRYYAKQWSTNWMPPTSSQPDECCWQRDGKPERDCWQIASAEERESSYGQENKYDRTMSGNGWEYENDPSERIALDLETMAKEEVQEFLGSSSEGEDSSSDVSNLSDDGVVVIPAPKPEKNGKQREEESFKFFMQLFEDNMDLQNLYKENWNVASFTCLVCSTIPARAAKRYHSINNLVTHAAQVTRPPRLRAHRGYARAIRCLLGWDEPGDPHP